MGSRKFWKDMRVMGLTFQAISVAVWLFYTEIYYDMWIYVIVGTIFGVLTMLLYFIMRLLIELLLRREAPADDKN